MKNLIVFVLVAMTVASLAQSATSVPHVGELLPRFQLENVKYYKHPVITNDSFKGKWLILHFWSLGCGSAVKSLDMANDIQRKFARDLQVVTIGHRYGAMNEEGIEVVFERKKRTHDYRLPVAYDTVLYKEWSLNGVPTIYIVDPQGVLRYITSGDDLTLEKVKGIIEGKNIRLRPIGMNYTETSGKDLFKETLRDEDITYASVLTKWHGEYPNMGYEIDRFVQLPDSYKREGWSTAFASLLRLYQYAYYGQGWFFMADTAYYGKVFETPILEVEDPTPFTFRDFSTGRGYYNYFLKLPLNKVNKVDMMQEMRTMLKDAFGYVACVEVREMPVWRLEASANKFDGLRTKGGKPEFFGINSVAGVRVRNYPIKQFLRLVTANLPNEDKAPFLDYTGIDFRIDANIQTDMTDLRSVQEALNRYGLRLVKGTKEMKVLVIRDPGIQ